MPKYIVQPYKDDEIISLIDRAETMTWLLQGYINSLLNKEDLITVTNGLEILQEQITDIYRRAISCEIKLEVKS
ncbi:hypothetical protein SAMN05660772_00991 [Pasteurella testudinis DSM 23072]|uniref:Uncharacterized protein n=1 Tax=Pasteurella testudinis DSM 23072 TaxID=1122938 RepID=A0A1W1V397_9PAST|nr:hypothetical protein [Pasteurella testudinis]SMB87514.1 hypothetical protein SAMN05660772_00991 [Pasteurella testudinis DSM 23072]SUB50528.1 Uncharacterised protein [Pasteurella testudinis]